MSNIVSSVGKRVRQLRTQSRMTQEQLAERSEISVSFLSMIERGERSPHLETLERLARGLEVKIEELFRGAAASEAPAATSPADAPGIPDSRMRRVDGQPVRIGDSARDGIDAKIEQMEGLKIEPLESEHAPQRDAAPKR